MKAQHMGLACRNKMELQLARRRQELDRSNLDLGRQAREILWFWILQDISKSNILAAFKKHFITKTIARWRLQV